MCLQQKIIRLRHNIAFEYNRRLISILYLHRTPVTFDPFEQTASTYADTRSFKKSRLFMSSFEAFSFRTWFESLFLFFSTNKKLNRRTNILKELNSTKSFYIDCFNIHYIFFLTINVLANVD